VTNLATVQRSQATGEFVRQLFAVLERTGVRYCVLHGWDVLPETVSSDLDLVVHPSDVGRLQIVFAEMASAGYKWIQCRHYAGCSYRFDFAWFEGKTFHVVGVDYISEYRYAGLILRSGEDLLSGRRQFRGFWIAGIETAFAYMLMKKSLKGSISAEQMEELQEISAELGAQRAKQIAGEVFGAASSQAVIKAIAEESLPAMLPRLRAMLGKNLRRHHPGMLFRYHVVEKLRQAKRWLRPTGVMLVALGPDGVGKSTLLAQLAENLQPAFGGIHFFHYRARLGSQPSVPVLNPHAQPPRGYLLSVARLVLLYFQFWFSYLFIVRPHLERSGLVVFDRYFHDLLVDIERYRYAGPRWLPRAMLKLMPNTHIFLLVLDADEKVVHARKQEVPIDKLRKFREGYKELALATPNAALIRTDVAIEETAAAATAAVCRYLLRRWSRRHPEWTNDFVSVASDAGAATS
jgi:thymidylate kinase